MGGEPYKLKPEGWARKSHRKVRAEERMGRVTEVSTVIIHLSRPAVRVPMCAFVSVFLTEDQIPHGFPTIDMGPQLKVVERTRTATMLCAASGNPDPEIYWFKDFLPVDISSSNGRIKQLRSGKTLVSTRSHTVAHVAQNIIQNREAANTPDISPW